jgi:hypothetical protein
VRRTREITETVNVTVPSRKRLTQDEILTATLSLVSTAHDDEWCVEDEEESQERRVVLLTVEGVKK